MSSPIPENAAPPPVAGTPETTPGVKESKEKNRGWPKGKKRYPKSPGAPKQPLSGYVHFLNDRREAVRKENPDITFADISKKLAVEWGQVNESLKAEYVKRAEADKERYNKEFAAYQQTQDYKDFIKEQEKQWANDSVTSEASPAAGAKKAKKDESGGGGGGSSSSTIKKSKKKKSETTVKTEDVSTPSSPAPPPSSNSNALGASQTIDIPIFTEEFLEHNKSKESELRQLRKQANEFEEKNAILQKHVENMRSAISKLEIETVQQQESNGNLAKHLESLRRLVIAHFSGTHLSPQRKEPLTMDNVDSYMQELQTIVTERPKENEALVAKAKDIASRMNYDSLTSSSQS